jgi:hypothetical protein
VNRQVQAFRHLRSEKFAKLVVLFRGPAKVPERPRDARDLQTGGQVSDGAPGLFPAGTFKMGRFPRPVWKVPHKAGHPSPAQFSSWQFFLGDASVQRLRVGSRNVAIDLD